MGTRFRGVAHGPQPPEAVPPYAAEHVRSAEQAPAVAVEVEVSIVRTSTWSVRFTLPKDESKGRSWGVNLTATCVCDTAERACALVKAAHADAVVYQVNHKGNDVTYVDAMVTACLNFVRVGTKCPNNRHGYSPHVVNDHGRCSLCAAVVVEPEDLAPELPSTPKAES